MSLLARIVPTFLRSTTMCLPGTGPSTSLVPTSTNIINLHGPSMGTSLFGQTIRTIIRCHFPRPSERKRIKRHGFKTRMSTPEGRRILMRRILKGRYVISH